MARVLLIDDDHDRTEIIARGLRAEGLEVVHVGTRREAFVALDGPDPFDCALVVLALPTGDRLELAKELHARFPGLHVGLARGHKLSVRPNEHTSERTLRFESVPEDGQKLARALRSRLIAA